MSTASSFCGPLLSQLRAESDKYREYALFCCCYTQANERVGEMLEKEMRTRVGRDETHSELSSIGEVCGIALR